jgi:hypothetical protein
MADRYEIRQDLTQASGKYRLLWSIWDHQAGRIVTSAYSLKALKRNAAKLRLEIPCRK